MRLTFMISTLVVSVLSWKTGCAQVVLDPGDCLGCYRYTIPMHCDKVLPPAPERCNNAGPCQGVLENGEVKMKCLNLSYEEDRVADPWLKKIIQAGQGELGQVCWKEEWKVCILRHKCGCQPNSSNVISCVTTATDAGERGAAQETLYSDTCTGGSVPQ